MKKGKLGISLNTYAIISFVLAMFGQMILAALVLGFVLVVEKDEWTSRQCMQAFFLTFVNSVVGMVTGALGVSGVGLLSISSLSYYGGVSAVFSLGAILLAGAISIVVLIFEILGLVRVVKYNEANIPLLSGWCYRAFGYVQQRQAAQQPQYPPQGYYPQPPAGAQPPVPPQAPMGQPPMNAQAPVSPAPEQPSYGQPPVNPEQPPQQ